MYIIYPYYIYNMLVSVSAASNKINFQCHFTPLRSWPTIANMGDLSRLWGERGNGV